MKITKEGFLLGAAIGGIASGYFALAAEKGREEIEADIRGRNTFARAVQCSHEIYSLEAAGAGISGLEKRALGDRTRLICLTSDEARPEQVRDYRKS